MAGRTNGNGAALVTGASGGIGLELARLLAADGHDLVLVARRAAELVRLADSLKRDHGVKAHVVPADLNDASAPGRIADAVKAAGIDVGILVNNAGFGIRGAFASTPIARQMEMLQVNVAALTHLTGLFLPGMVARGSGRIMNVASTAAFQPGPGMAVYYASKAYVLSFSVALSVELERTGVSVTAFCPGPTITGFQAVAGVADSRLFRMGAAAAEPVARVGYLAMKRGTAVVVPGIRNRVMGIAAQVSPRYLTAKIAGWLHVLRNRPTA